MANPSASFNIVTTLGVAVRPFWVKLQGPPRPGVRGNGGRRSILWKGYPKTDAENPHASLSEAGLGSPLLGFTVNLDSTGFR